MTTQTVSDRAIAAQPSVTAVAQTHDVAITGGGLVGLTLALALAQGGLRVVVIDPADPGTILAPGFDGRATAIASAVQAMFDTLGLGPALRPHSCPIKQIWVSDQLRPGEVDFVPAEASDALGHMHENRYLRAALHKAASTTDGIDLRMQDRVVERVVDGHRVTLTLASGQRIVAPVHVVAEGRHSPTREDEGIRSARWDYGHHAIIGAIAHEHPHEHIAYEIFYPEGPFALLPLNDLDDGRHRSAFVWSVPARDGPATMKLGDRGFVAAMRGRMGNVLGDIALVAPRQSYSLTFQHSARITAPRTALVGDTAHGIHPIAGQGLNLGLRDAAALAEVLVDGARLGLDLGDAALLARYQRWRGMDSLTVAATTDGLTRLFGVPGRAASLVRRTGLRAVQAVPMTKSFFMSQARGQAGTLPKLLAGQPLG